MKKNSQLKLETSLGTFPVEVKSEFRLSESGSSLIIKETRSFRKQDEPMISWFNNAK